MALDRRRFLALGVGGAAVLAVGGVGLSLQGTVPRAASGPLAALTPAQFSVLAAIADRLCPGGDGFPTAGELRVAEGVDALLATMHPAAAAELGQALLLVENALTGVVFDGRFVPFTAASPEAQDAALDGWRTSRIGLRRKVYKALRGLVISTYYANPAIAPLVGYPGPPDVSALIAARVAAGEIAP